jgi:proteasome lid subunit RPN8/RPN11
MSDAADPTTLGHQGGASEFAAESGERVGNSDGAPGLGGPPPLRPWAAEIAGGHPDGGLHGPHQAPLLELPTSAVESVREAARRAWPQEACGLLLGSPLGDGPNSECGGRNATREVARDRYEVHPEDFLAADDRARELGLEVVGVWHSHPESGPIPSKTDFERSWPGWSYLICGWPDGDPDSAPLLRSWRRTEAAAPFVEERLSARLD